MAYTDSKYSLNLLFCNREAWLHVKSKDSNGNLPSHEVPNFLFSQIVLQFENIFILRPEINVCWND